MSERVEFRLRHHDKDGEIDGTHVNTRLILPEHLNELQAIMEKHEWGLVALLEILEAAYAAGFINDPQPSNYSLEMLRPDKPSIVV